MQKNHIQRTFWRRFCRKLAKFRCVICFGFFFWLNLRTFTRVQSHPTHNIHIHTHTKHTQVYHLALDLISPISERCLWPATTAWRWISYSRSFSRSAVRINHLVTVIPLILFSHSLSSFFRLRRSTRTIPFWSVFFWNLIHILLMVCQWIRYYYSDCTTTTTKNHEHTNNRWCLIELASPDEWRL